MSAGRIVGRIGCPWCGFEAAHVKQGDGKHPYHHCPECGMLATCRNGMQAANMRARMRPVDAAPATPADAPAIQRRGDDIVMPPAAPAAPAAPADPPKPARRGSPWAPLLGALK